MMMSLLHTARGQATIALAGVLLIACAATWNTYQGTREHARDRAVLALVARQRHLAHDLSVSDAHATPHALLGKLAAADANFHLLLGFATPPGQSVPDLHASIVAARQEWAAFRQAVSSPGAVGRQTRYIRMIQRLNTVAAPHEHLLAAAVRAQAGRQAIILAFAAPLLAWAFLAVSRAAVPLTAEERPLAESASARAARAQARFEWRDLGSTPPPPTAPARIGVGASLMRAPDLARELRTYAADFRQMAGLAVELALDERAAAAVPASARPQALTIAREAIADTRRHGGATRVSIALWQDIGGVWLAVADDGVRAAHPDMPITRARAERIGGELRVCAQSDGGTLVLARLPMEEPAEPVSAPPVGAPRRAW